MTARGAHFAIEEDDARRLLAAVGDDERLQEIVVEEIEESSDRQHQFDHDKAWDALHRCFGDGTLNAGTGERPLNLCFFGGRMLNQESFDFVVLLEPSEVREVAAALAPVTESWLRKRYDSLDFLDYHQGKSDEDFRYTWTSFDGLPEFFSRAAREGRWVIFTMSQ